MTKKKLAPICLFVYNRLYETKKTISSLQKNYLAKESDLIIFSDGFKDSEDKKQVLEVRSFLNDITGFRSVKVKIMDVNKGLARSVIDGVSYILQKNPNVIVLEDDLVTTPNFLDFINQGLRYYSSFKNVYAINGYSLDIGNVKYSMYKTYRSFPWGWATWKDRWNAQDFSNKSIKKQINNIVLKKFKSVCGDDVIRMLKDSLYKVNDSWYIRWVFINFLKERVAVFPSTSKVINIGLTVGTHSNEVFTYQSINDTNFSVEFNFQDISKLTLSKKSFLNYFTFKYKFMYRVKMLKKISGIKKLFREINKKIFKNV